VADAGPSVIAGPTRTSGGRLAGLARQREVGLLAILVVLGAAVSIKAPQFLTVANLSQVAVLASVTAVAALGEALVILTRNVDLSVEATIGIVAYVVAVTLEGHTVAVPVAIALGIGLGLVLGIINGILVAFLRVPSIVATLGTLSVFRGVDYFIAGSHQVPLASLPDGFTDAARSDLFGIPLFVILTVALVAVGTLILRSTRFGRQIYAVGSNPEAAAVLGIPSRLVVFAVFALCGALAGVAGVLWVMEFGTINGTAATGAVLAIVAAAVVGGVNIFGGSGTLAGAALGALFLGFVANALPLIGLNQFYLQAIYGAVILVAISTDAIIVRRLQRSRTRRSGR
jgi:rhamnose transport system permease protein